MSSISVAHCFECLLSFRHAMDSARLPILSSGPHANVDPIQLYRILSAHVAPATLQLQSSFVLHSSEGSGCVPQVVEPVYYSLSIFRLCAAKLQLVLCVCSFVCKCPFIPSCVYFISHPISPWPQAMIYPRAYRSLLIPLLPLSGAFEPRLKKPMRLDAGGSHCIQTTQNRMRFSHTKVDQCYGCVRYGCGM